MMSNLRQRVIEYLGLALVLLALVAFFGTLTEHFFSATTLRTVANQMPEAVLVAVGMTYVLVIGGIDLSVGAVLGLGGAVLGASLTRWGLPLPAAIAVCVGVGAGCGLFNGLTVVRWSLPSFIVTLGMLEAARGGTYLVSASRTAYVGAQVERIAEIDLAGLSLPFLCAIAVAVLGQLVLTRTVFGRYMIAIGTNEEAVRLSGIDPRPVKVAVFVISGVLASLASVGNVARLGASDPNAGIGFELSAIAAVVIGGTSLMGGRGSVVNSVLGVAIIAVLENGLAQMGAQEPAKRLVTGAVIVGAVILDYYRARLRRRSAALPRPMPSR
jgi:ribose transport system permease protein